MAQPPLSAPVGVCSNGRIRNRFMKPLSKSEVVSAPKNRSGVAAAMMEGAAHSILVPASLAFVGVLKLLKPFQHFFNVPIMFLTKALLPWHLILSSSSPNSSTKQMNSGFCANLFIDPGELANSLSPIRCGATADIMVSPRWSGSSLPQPVGARWER